MHCRISSVFVLLMSYSFQTITILVTKRPWGILGLYEHLASIRVDIEWAEDAAWRRANGQS